MSQQARHPPLQESYEPSPREEEVLHAVKNEPLSRVTTQYLHERTGITEKEVRTALENLEDAGWLHELSDDFFELVRDPRLTPQISDRARLAPSTTALSDFGTNSGEPSDITGTGNNTAHDFKELINDLDDEHEHGAPTDLVVEQAQEELDLEEDNIDSRIDSLKRRGEIYQPKDGHIRVT